MQLTERDVEWRVYAVPEDLELSAEDWADEQTRRQIESELARGNRWAWCTAIVEARYEDRVGRDYLGACSYRSAEDFKRNSGYYEDMQSRALADLNRQLSRSRTGELVKGTALPIEGEWEKDEI